MTIPWNEIGAFCSGVACTLIAFKDVLENGYKWKKQQREIMEALIYGQSHYTDMYGVGGFLGKIGSSLSKR